MQTVLVEVPPELREAKAKWNRFKYHNESSHHIDTRSRVVGLTRVRFAQRQMIGNMHATVHAFEELSCNGYIGISIERGHCVVEASIKVIDEHHKEIATKALQEVESTARTFGELYPNSSYSLSFRVSTTFSDVRPNG